MLIAQIQYLKAENRILRARCGDKIMTTPEERMMLLQYGLPLGDAIKDIIGIVTYKTFQRLKRKFEDPDYKPKRTGRPRITASL